MSMRPDGTGTPFQLPSTGMGTDNAGAPTQLNDPNELDVLQRLAGIEKASGGTLPARMSLDLAQGPLDHRAVRRAAGMLASQFSLTPEMVFAPYTAQNIGQSATNQWFADPVNPLMPISLATARRFMASNETQILRRWLARAARPTLGEIPAGQLGPPSRVPGVDPSTIANIFSAFAPIQGENVPLQDALGAAISIARGSKVTPRLLDMLKANLTITAQSTALTPAEQIAAAQTATAKGVTLRSIADIPTAILSGPLGDLLQAGQTGVAAGAGFVHPAPAPYAGPFPSRITGGPEAASQQALAAAGGGNKEFGQLNIDFYKKAEAGLLGSGDWFKFLQDQTTDYVTEGQKLVAEQNASPIPFANTGVGRNIGKVLNIINRPLEAAWRALISPQDPLVFVTAALHDLTHGNLNQTTWEAQRFASPAEIAHTGRDILEIIHGHQSAVTQLQDEYGIAPWISAVGELALASVAADIPVLRVAVDPAGAGLQSWESYKAHFLISGLAEDGKSAEAAAKLQHWKYSPTSHIGDLRNVSPLQYLVREGSRTDDPEKFFNRAVDSFMTWHKSYGIDWITSSRVWTEIKSLKAVGASEDTIVRAIDPIFDAAWGITPRTDSIAAEIRGLAEKQAALSTADVQSEILAHSGQVDPFAEHAFTPADRPPTFGESIGPLTTGNDNIDMALATLDDAAFDARAGNIHMTEVPHHAGPLVLAKHALRTSDLGGSMVGKLASSLLAENPRLVGPNMVIPHEGLQAVPDFRRALIRGQAHNPQEIAVAERSWAAALDPLNPSREQDIRKVIGRYNTEIIQRTNRRYGIGEELQKMILDKASSTMGGRSNVFAALGDATTEGVKQIKSPFWASQLDNYSEMIDPVLYRQGIANITGQLRKWERGMSSSLGVPLETLKASDAVAVPIARWTKEVVDGAVAQTFLSVWKPLIVMRPAHIMRVVVVNEMSHVLAVGGMMRYLEASHWSAKILDRLGMAHDDFLPLGIDVGTRAGQRDSTIEDALLALDGNGKPKVGHDLGFAPRDAEEGHALAEAVRAGGLNPNLRRYAAEMVSAYREQLSGIGIDTESFIRGLNVKGSATKAAARALRNDANVAEGTLRIRLPGLDADDPLAMSNAGRLTMTSVESRRSELKGLTTNIGVVERSNPQYYDSLYAVLQNQAGRDPVARMQLRAIAEGTSVDDAIREQMTFLTDPKGEGPRYANRLMGSTKANYTAEDLHAKLELGNNYLHQLTGKYPSVARAAYNDGLTMDALRAVPEDALPLYVHGHLMNKSFWRGDTVFNHARNQISHAIMEAPTNVLSRQPFFHMWKTRMLKGLIETEQARNPGVAITAEKLAGFEATSRDFALSQVDRILYDYSRSNRFAEITRLATVFTHPFLAFPLTWGRVLRSNPSFIREATLLGKTGLQSGFIKQDPTSGEYVIPESWFAGAAPLLAMFTGTHIGAGKLTGGGWSLSAPLRAFVAFSESAFPLPTGGIAGDIPIPLPGLSPPFQFAMQQWLKRSDLPEHYKAMLNSYLFQYGEIGPTNWEGLLPAYMRHGLEAAFPDQFQGVTENAQDHFLQVQEAMGLAPNIQHARGQARAFAFARMFFSGLFPAAPTISYPTKELETEYKTLTDSLGFSAGREQFLKIHPDLTLLTLARTAWEGGTPENPSPVPLPANKFVDELLAGKGAKEFARRYPDWVWAIIPSELSKGQFDAGAFFAQLANGQRVSKSPEAFLQEEQVQKGWDSFFIEQSLHNNWLDLNPTLGQTDPGFTAETARHNAAVDAIKVEHPAWVSHFDTFSAQAVDPNVLATARRLASDPMFARTSVGQGLVAYLALRDEANTKLADANISSLNSTSAHDLGITAAYEQGVNDIVTAHPDFGTAYRLMFTNDLRTGIVTAGQKASLDIRAADPTFYDTRLNPWWTQWEQLRTAPDKAPNQATAEAAFEAVRVFVNSSYETFPAGKNPMVLRWQSYSPTDKETYLAGLVGRKYEYATRFDRAQIMGVPTDSTSEDLWSQYEQLRGAIFNANDTNPNFNMGAAFDALNGWVLANSKSNPTFGTQVMAANTLGYTFAKVRHQLFPATSPQTDASWGAFLDALGQVQAIVEKYGLTGSSDMNSAHRQAYMAMGNALQSQVDALSARDIGFAQQWAMLEDNFSGSTPAMEKYFLPATYHPIGSARLIGNPAAP